MPDTFLRKPLQVGDPEQRCIWSILGTSELFQIHMESVTPIVYTEYHRAANLVSLSGIKCSKELAEHQWALGLKMCAGKMKLIDNELWIARVPKDFGTDTFAIINVNQSNKYHMEFVGAFKSTAHSFLVSDIFDHYGTYEYTVAGHYLLGDLHAWDIVDKPLLTFPEWGQLHLRHR